MWGLLFFLSIAFAGTWQVVPITPNCQNGLYCSKDEIPQEVMDAGIVQRLVQMSELAYADKGRVTLAFMSFTEPILFQALCELTRKGLELDGFFDAKAGPPQGLAYRLESECQAENLHNVRIYYMGMNAVRKTWRLHHNKFFISEYGQNRSQVQMAFGSANLSGHGLSINFENWNFVTGLREEAMIHDHFCVVEAMRSAREARAAEDDPRVFRKIADNCFTYRDIDPRRADVILTKEGVWTLFTPDPQDRVFKLLELQIDSVLPGGRIRMAAYYFTHRPLAEALQRAKQRGVQIDLILDDDIYKGGGIPSQRKFYNNYLREKVSGYDLKVFATPQGTFQIHHHKFLILEGVGEKRKTRVFLTAAQFTLVAFKKNYENFYLVETPEVVEQFQKLYTDLWALANDIH
jgi:hypothetical protein